MYSFLLSPTPNYATSHSAVSSVMFFDRNTSMSLSADVGFRLAHRLTVTPPLENSLSEGTEVAVIPKYFSVRRRVAPPTASLATFPYFYRQN